MSLAEKLAELSRAYAKRVPDKVAALGDALDALRASYDAGALYDAWQHAHKMKGTAASHGFPQLTEACAGIEEALEPFRVAEVAPDEAAWVRIDEAYALARAQVPTLVSTSMSSTPTPE